MTLPVLIDSRLSTASYWMPVQEQWIDVPDNVTLQAHPAPSDVANHRGLCLVDSVLASKLLPNFQIIAEHGVSWSRISPLTMVTDRRPDAVDEATVSSGEISLAGRALAEVVVPSFYGIAITSWTSGQTEPGEATVLVTEDEQALQTSAGEDDYYEDLGRAWYLLTETPYPSHLCLVPRDLAAGDLEQVIETVEWLDQLLALSRERRRELRRNLSRHLDVDRELVTDTIDSQSNRIEDIELAGLKTLYNRIGVNIDERMLAPLHAHR